MLDISPVKLLVVAVIAMFLIGPEKLPLYAAQLGRWVRIARSMVDQGKARLADELGPDHGGVDWADLDPRRYDPRRVIADAWNSTPPPAATASTRTAQLDDDAEPDLLELADRRARDAQAPRREAGHFEIGS